MQFRTVLINYFRLTYSRGSFTVIYIELRDMDPFLKLDLCDKNNLQIN